MTTSRAELILGRLTPPVALALVALLQTAVLAWMVIDRTRLIKTGREIVLPIRPVDPRDLFRGQYVRLGYDVSQVPVRLIEGPLPGRNDPFFVTIEQQTDGSWRPLKLTRTQPASLGPGQMSIRARAINTFPQTLQEGGSVFVRYGIESYFVEEGQGPRLEALARDKKLAALIAVDRRGNAAIKGIYIDGKLQYSESLL